MGEDQAVDVHVAVSPTELDQARTLFRAFVAWHQDGHVEDLDLIDRYLPEPGFCGGETLLRHTATAARLAGVPPADPLGRV